MAGDYFGRVLHDWYSQPSYVCSLSTNHTLGRLAIAHMVERVVVNVGIGTVVLSFSVARWVSNLG